MVRALFAYMVHNSCGDSMIDRYASDDTDFWVSRNLVGINFGLLVKTGAETA